MSPGRLIRRCGRGGKRVARTFDQKVRITRRVSRSVDFKSNAFRRSAGMEGNLNIPDRLPDRIAEVREVHRRHRRRQMPFPLHRGQFHTSAFHFCFLCVNPLLREYSCGTIFFQVGLKSLFFGGYSLVFAFFRGILSPCTLKRQGEFDVGKLRTRLVKNGDSPQTRSYRQRRRCRN